MSRDNDVHSKSVRNKLDRLEAKLHAAEMRAARIRREIEELIVGQSAITVGARITWVSGGRERYGRVVSIRTAYRGFEYRVEVTTKCGRVIGNATITESQEPALRD